MARRHLRDAGADWETGPTEPMIAAYNRMAAAGEAVGALLHTHVLRRTG